MKQLIGYFITILLWILSIIVWAAAAFPWLFAALFLLHFAELILIGYRTGAIMNKTPAQSIAMCLLFGFNWWLPLRRTMKADDLTDEDFIEDNLEPWREPQTASVDAFSSESMVQENREIHA